MLKLMQLEMKKFKLGRNGVIIATLIILGLTLMISFGSKNEGTVSFENLDQAFSVINTMVRDVFIIFEAVLIGEMVIGEFKNKTISVLFMYPVNRKKLMVAKLLLITGFIFSVILLSNIFIDCTYYLINSRMHFTADNLTNVIIFKRIINICVDAACFTCMGLITVFFGMKKKSMAQTIVAAIILVCIIGGNFGKNFSLSSIIAIPVTLAIIGLLIAYLSIRNIEDRDLSN